MWIEKHVSAYPFASVYKSTCIIEKITEKWSRGEN